MKFAFVAVAFRKDSVPETVKFLVSLLPDTYTAGHSLLVLNTLVYSVTRKIIKFILLGVLHCALYLPSFAVLSLPP
jgi:hypothetical protein